MNAELQAPASPSDGLAPVYAQYPIEVVAAEGVWLHTRDGRKLLDLYGGHAVASLGYGHAGWTQALATQAAQMNFQTNAVPMEIRARAAQKLLKFSKLPFDSVFWINSGAEANENAFKMAFKMRPGRTHVAAIEQSFHGRTAACASTTWGAPGKWYFLPRAPFAVSWIKRRDVGDIATHVTENTAAVIVEPVQGVGGAFDMGQEFLAALRRRCDETGALLIFDEVQCGVGRSGTPFAANYYGVMPDILTTAKALGNGFPVSAMLLTPPITAALKPENLGTTFGGGPMACAVAEATIDAIEKEGLLENVTRVSAYLRQTCRVGPVVDFQGLGFLHGLRLNKPAKDVQKALLAKDILAGTAGDPAILRLLPAFILEEEHIDRLRDALSGL
jgi:acetylornithine/succinyldiaminopimelate/putrescine aminotransferase